MISITLAWWMILGGSNVVKAFSSSSLSFLNTERRERSHRAAARVPVQTRPVSYPDRASVVAFQSSTPNENDNIPNDLRRMLELSWNVDTMGDVPNTPEAAAEAAAQALKEALVSSTDQIFMVDLLLPIYDVSGPAYDEVLAVEFCTALAKSMIGNTLDRAAIFVRDDIILNPVMRILDARENDTKVPKSKPKQPEKTLEEDVKTESPAVAEEPSTGNSVVVEFYDDFADMDGIGSIASSNTPESSIGSEAGDTDTSSTQEPLNEDVDTFRQQLMSTWDDTTESTEDSLENTGEKGGDEVEETMQSASDLAAIDSETVNDGEEAEARFRVGSLLGDPSHISSGPDMLTDVVQAVSDNVVMDEEENLIILLSPHTPEEMIAVRSVIGKYGTSNKTIVLVNCELDPLPRELIRTDVVYSILPLIAASRNPQEDEKRPNPKIVLLRRYPKDWEIYVDITPSGEGGFELVDTIPADQVGNKGPPLDYVASLIKKHLQQRFDTY
eukprot:scaffold81762_cov46-Attheya_sp.AAC.1